MLAAGTRLERYIVEREIGEGGMATVYRVRHAALGSPHALKLLHSRASGLKERLLQEGRLQATLRHRNIVAVTDVIDIDGSPGLVMEFVPGQPLDVWLDTARYDLDARLAIFKGILAGVGAAHAAGLVHRDLKPANVLLDMGETPPVPKVADFGIAKLLEEDGPGRTRSGMAMGTLVYMSPEQTRNAKGVDSRCDIYALACMLYEMVCEQRPFEGSDLWEVLQQKMGSRYADPRELRPDLPENVLVAIRLGLAPEVDMRLPDVETFAAVLSGAIDGQELERTLGMARKAPSGAETQFGMLDEPEGSLAPTPAPTGPTPVRAPGRVASVPVVSSVPTSAPPSASTIAPASASTSVILRPVLASAFTALLLGGGFALWSATSSREGAASPDPVMSVPTAVPTSTATSPSPTVPMPVPSTPPPVAPPPVAPAPVAATATTTARPPPAKATLPAAPALTSPGPVTSTPAVAAVTAAPSTPESAAATGTVTLTGPISAAWLEDSGGERHKPGALPPGTYQLRVRFEGTADFVPAATVNLRAGQSVSYRCDPGFGLCKRGD